MHGLPLEPALRQVVIAQGAEHSNRSGAAKGHKPGKVMPSSKQSRTRHVPCVFQALDSITQSLCSPAQGCKARLAGANM